MVTVVGSMMWATMKNFLEVHAVKSDNKSSEGASNTNCYKLKRNCWINNSSRTSVAFYVYNCNDLFNLRWIPARTVYMLSLMKQSKYTVVGSRNRNAITW